MSAETVRIDGIEAALRDVLTAYSDEIHGETVKLVKNIAKKTLKNLEKDSPRSRGEYAKGWKVKTRQSASEAEAVLYNQLPGLTHLLENGHQLRQGGRSPALPHIRKNERRAVRDFESGCEDILRNAGY